MRPGAVITSSALLLSSLVWGLAVGFGTGPWSGWSAVWLGGEMVFAGTLSLVGMLVGASRWGRRLGMGVAAAGLASAVVVPVESWWWWLGLVSSAAALGGLAGRAMKGYVRERPAAAGPPPRAVGAVLAVLFSPAVVAAVVPSMPASTAILLAAVWVGGVWYAKAAPGALFVVRVVVPSLALAAALTLEPGGAVACLVVAATVAALAWSKDARLAVHPLVERGTAVPIPPELVPREILDEAGLDSRGRRKSG
ncbi:MAG: hypothetical protein KatS3mg011_1809 [Acidimicrobiia bacterium]|nr:MAG: hypothetical protein KatS3mg011_1809 [Acidimicrobiia bacterium]